MKNFTISINKPSTFECILPAELESEEEIKDFISIIFQSFTELDEIIESSTLIDYMEITETSDNKLSIEIEYDDDVPESELFDFHELVLTAIKDISDSEPSATYTSNEFIFKLYITDKYQMELIDIE